MLKKAIALALIGASVLAPVYAKGQITVYGPDKGAVKSTCTATGGGGGASMRAKGFYSFVGSGLDGKTEAQRTLTITVNASAGSGYGTGGKGGGLSSIVFAGSKNIIFMAGGGGGGGGIATSTLTPYANHEWKEQHDYQTCTATNGSSGATASLSNSAGQAGSIAGGSGTAEAGGGGGGGNKGGVGGSGTLGGAAGRISGEKAKSSCSDSDITNETTCFVTKTATGTPQVKVSYIRESLATF